MSEPHRPVLRWHGGKWLQAPRIIEHLPPNHRVYVEPFGGAASILLRKERAYAEVYNDLDGDVVNLFRVLQDPATSDRLRELLYLTPFAREEFVHAYEPTEDPVEQARRLVVRSFMGFGSNGHNPALKTGFRDSSTRSGTTPARDWQNYPDCLPAIVDRLRGVVVESRPALAVMKKHDSPDTLHLLDPPYVASTRSQKRRKGGLRYHTYTHEMTLRQHRTLLAAAKTLKGMVVICGYANPTYERALKGWHRVETDALADGAKERIEVMWMNPAAAARMPQPDLVSEMLRA